jgi:hypothetical protein
MRSVVHNESMISTEQLTEILETAIFSACIEGALPVSMMLVGPSGVGKSKLVMQYQNSIGCHITTDITSMGLQELMAKDTKELIRFIVIPDFNIVLSHRRSTLNLTIGNLLSMTSEGMIRIDDGRNVKETKHRPVGIISAMTRDMYAGIGKTWSSLGFNRRFIPINYDYGLMTREHIQTSIANGLTTLLQLAEKKIDISQVTHVEISKEHSSRLEKFSQELAVNIGWMPLRQKYSIHHRSGDEQQFKPKAIFTGKQLEFTPHLVLRTLARAHALRDDRKEVMEDDVTFCMKVIAFTRFDQPVML